MLTASPRAGRTPADDNRCRHLTLGGARCTMPTLHGKDLCHQHGHRDKVLRVKPALTDNLPRTPIVTFVYMEDHDGVLANLNAVADAFSRHSIDRRDVASLTYLMNTALKTLRQKSQIEKPISAEEIVRDVVYNDLNQPLAADPEQATEPEPVPAPNAELQPQPKAEIQPEPESQPKPTAQVILRTLSQADGDEESAAGCPSAFPNEATDANTADPSTPEPIQIQTLKASIDPNPSISHTYRNQKKQPSSFHTHAETRGRG